MKAKQEKFCETCRYYNSLVGICQKENVKTTSFSWCKSGWRKKNGFVKSLSNFTSDSKGFTQEDLDVAHAWLRSKNGELMSISLKSKVAEIVTVKEKGRDNEL